MVVSILSAHGRALKHEVREGAERRIPVSILSAHGRALKLSAPLPPDTMHQRPGFNTFGSR